MKTFDVLLEWTRNVMGWRRGERVRVSRDEYVARLIANGLVRVVEDYTPAEPSIKASKKEWAEFMEARGYEVHPQMTRKRLIETWENRNL